MVDRGDTRTLQLRCWSNHAVCGVAPWRTAKKNECPPSLVCSVCAPSSDKPAVVFEAQSSKGAYRSYEFAYVNKKHEDPRCRSCVFLGRGIRNGKMRAGTTWCQACIFAHTCIGCKKITHMVDAVPVCKKVTCTDINFVQWTCDVSFSSLLLAREVTNL